MVSRKLLCLLILAALVPLTPESLSTEVQGNLKKTSSRYGSKQHIEELVVLALELGATPEQIKSVCRTSPLCAAALAEELKNRSEQE